MVKSVLSVSHQGLRDWIIQRVSAVVMAVYLVGLMSYLLFNPELSFAEWHALFSTAWMKVATILFLLGMVGHAWIGMWTIVTDYVQPYCIRCVVHVTIFLMLAACFIWGLLMVWSV